MIRFIKPLTALLAMSFSTTSVRGQNNECITGGTTRCTANTASLDLQNCGISDNDIDDLKACFDSIGRDSITHILMSGNALSTVSAGIFVDLTMMLELDLRSNDIMTIATGAFDDIPVLDKLSLSSNMISDVSAGTFFNLPAITFLTLASNVIETIEVGSFADLGTLLFLRLEGNLLETLPADLFAGLMVLDRLDLSDNNIMIIENGAFTDLIAVTDLSLEENQIEILQTDLFAGMVALEDLNLDENMITTIEANAFRDLAVLDELLMNENMIANVDANAFMGLVALDTLDLEENMIESLDPNIFADLSAIRVIELDDNNLKTLDSAIFNGLGTLRALFLNGNQLEALPEGIFDDLVLLQTMSLAENQLTTVPSNIFAKLEELTRLTLNDNLFGSLPADLFTNSPLITDMYLSGNQLSTLPEGIFDAQVHLTRLFLHDNQLTTVPSNIFDKLESLTRLTLNGNLLDSLPADAFTGLPVLAELRLQDNALTTLPAGLFEDVGSGTALTELNLAGNAGLQCVPTVFPSTLALPDTSGLCGCTPAAAVSCDAGMKCASGAVGYTCVVAVDCTNDMDCDTDNGEVCCPLTNVCEVKAEVDPSACGDPHMTGFRGQKFDFTGVDNGWYAVVSDLPHMHLNMRVTSPVPSVPEITYITGISIVTKDADGFDHSIVISVADPHNLESSCPVGASPCLADGALHVVVNGDEILTSPGEVTVAPGVAIAAVNLPGACRSFGFEKYWEAKKLERLALAGRRLSLTSTMQDMSDWILSDPTATNKVECEAYVASTTAAGGVDLFAKQSEHASFQIMTPAATIRLSHGRLHQLPMRDPSDQFDLPDHLTWQMNMAIDHSNIGPHATGILGETLVPTVDLTGAPIMQGMDAIRGQQEDYRVTGPLGLAFRQSKHHE